MTKRLSLMVVTLVMIMGLSGCANAQMELNLNSDSSGTYGITLGIDDESIEKYNITAKDLLSEVIETNNVLQTENTSYKVGDVEYTGIRAYFDFESIEDMQSKLNAVFGTVINKETGHKVPKYNIASGIKVEKENFWGKTVSINIPVENISGQRKDIQTLPDIGVGITFKMSLPGEILSTNANKSDKILEWNIDTNLKNIEATYSIDKEILGINTKYLTVLGGLVGIGIIITYVFIALMNKGSLKNKQ